MKTKGNRWKTDGKRLLRLTFFSAEVCEVLRAFWQSSDFSVQCTGGDASLPGAQRQDLHADVPVKEVADQPPGAGWRWSWPYFTLFASVSCCFEAWRKCRMME